MPIIRKTTEGLEGVDDMKKQIEEEDLYPDSETVKDYIIQKIMELQCELAILEDIARKLGIPECR